MPERPDPGSWPDGHALRAKKKRALTRTPGPGGCGGARPAAAGGSAARAQRGGGKAAAAGALAARPLCTLLPWSPPPCERRRCLRLGSGGNRREATEAPTPGAVGSGSPRGPTCCLPKTSPGSPARRPPEHDAVHADGPLPVLQGGLAGQVHELLRADDVLVVLQEAQRVGSGHSPPRPLRPPDLCRSPPGRGAGRSGAPAWGRGLAPNPTPRVQPADPLEQGMASCAGVSGRRSALPPRPGRELSRRLSLRAHTQAGGERGDPTTLKGVALSPSSRTRQISGVPPSTACHVKTARDAAQGTRECPVPTPNATLQRRAHSANVLPRSGTSPLYPQGLHCWSSDDVRK